MDREDLEICDVCGEPSELFDLCEKCQHLMCPRCFNEGCPYCELETKWVGNQADYRVMGIGNDGIYRVQKLETKQ